MSWIWPGIGGALLLGFCLGVTLMGVLYISRERATDGG
jgi:hypothetical protein